MKLKAANRYQAIGTFHAMGVFYLIFVGLIGLLMFLFTRVVGITDAVDISFTGTLPIAAVFLFVAALVSTREDMSYLLQNGVSRKTMFTSTLLVALGTAAVMAILDIAFTLLVGKFFFSYGIRIISDVYPNLPNLTIATSPLYFLYNLLELFGAYIGGIFLSMLFYRLNKAGKWLVPIGFFALILLLGIADMAWMAGVLANFFKRIDAWVMSGILNFSAMSILRLAFLIGASWLLIRRAPIRTMQ